MCGRYTLATDAVALAARFQAYVPPRLVAPTYNAAPTQGLPTILNANPYLITVSTWGFRPAWADWRDVTPLINARAETVASKPFFRQAFRSTRCLVLADGWFEGMQVNSIEPAAESESSRDGKLVLSYGALEPGDLLRIWLQFEVNPTNVGKRSYTVELDDEERLLARIPRTIRVLP